MQEYNFVKFFRLLWKLFSGIMSALGLASLADGVITWKNLIKKLLTWYQDIVHPILQSFFDFIHLDIPPGWYDYLIVGMIIGITVLKYYFIALFINRSQSNPGFSDMFDEKVSNLKWEFDRLNSEYRYGYIRRRVYVYQKIILQWKRFIWFLRGSILLGYTNPDSWWLHKAMMTLSFMYSLIFSVLLWPILLIFWIKKGLYLKGQGKVLYVYDAEIRMYKKVPEKVIYPIAKRRVLYYYDKDMLMYRKTVISNTHYFLEILGFIVIGLFLLIIISEFF